MEWLQLLCVRNSFLERLRHKENNKNPNESEERNIIWIRPTYLCKREGQIKKEVIFKTYHTHKKLPKSSSFKDKKTTDQKPNFTHCFNCLKWSEKCIGKTDPNIITCLHEH